METEGSLSLSFLPGDNNCSSCDPSFFHRMNTVTFGTCCKFKKKRKKKNAMVSFNVAHGVFLERSILLEQSHPLVCPHEGASMAGGAQNLSPQTGNRCSWFLKLGWFLTGCKSKVADASPPQASRAVDFRFDTHCSRWCGGAGPHSLRS